MAASNKVKNSGVQAALDMMPIESLADDGGDVEQDKETNKVQVDLQPRVKEQVERLAREQGVDVPTYITNLIRTTALPEGLGPKLQGEEFTRELDKLAEGLPELGDDIDDSRETIYAGRGE